MGIKDKIKWPIFLSRHGDEHLEKVGEYNTRISTISFDNAVELFLKNFLKPKRANFPLLLENLKKYAPEKITGFDLEEIFEFHKLRNHLYHEGEGIAFEKEKISRYSEITKILCYNLFRERIEKPEKYKLYESGKELFLNKELYENFFFQQLSKHPLDSLFYLYDYSCKKSKPHSINLLNEYSKEIRNDPHDFNNKVQSMPILEISLFLHCGTKIDPNVMFYLSKNLSPELISHKAKNDDYSYMVIQSICNAWTRMGRIHKVDSDKWKKLFLDSLPTEKLASQAEKRGAQHLYHLLKEFKRVAPKSGAKLIKAIPAQIIERKRVEAKGKGNLSSELSRISRRLLEHDK